MGVTRMNMESSMETRSGVYANVGIVRDFKGTIFMEFFLMDREGELPEDDDIATSCEDGVMQSRVIMSEESIRAFKYQLDKFVSELDSKETNND